MNIEEMSMKDVENRSAEIRELMEVEGADIDALTAETEKLEERKAQILKEAEERKAQMDEVESAKTVEDFKKENDNMEKELRTKLADALAESIKGRATEEQRALLSQNATNGTVALATIIDEYTWTDWTKSPILSRIRKAYIKGNYKVGYEASATGAVKHTEGANAPAEETLTLAYIDFVAEYYKKWITVSDTVLALRGEAFLDYLYDEFGHQLALALENAVVAELEASTLTAQVTHDIDAGAVLAGIGGLSDEAVNPVVIISKPNYVAIKEAAREANFDFDPFEGLEVLFNATATGVLVGDLDGVIANFPEGEEFRYIVDDKTLAERDLIKIVGKILVAIHLVRPNGFALVKNA